MTNFFHGRIVAYLMFIFALMGFGCGYKAPPFYTQEGGVSQNLSQDSGVDSENEKPKKKVLFQEIGSQPSPSYEEDEE